MPKGLQKSNREKKKPKQEKSKKPAAAPSGGIKVQGQTVSMPGAKKSS
jgi:hypothetical protein